MGGKPPAATRSRAAIPPSVSAGAWQAPAPTTSRRAGRSPSRSRSIAPWWPHLPPPSASRTTSPSSSLPGTAALLALLRFVPPPAAVAQGGGRPFNVLEVGAGATVVAARSTFSGVGLGIGRRVGAGLPRLAPGAAGGAREGTAGRRSA